MICLESLTPILVINVLLLNWYNGYTNNCSFESEHKGLMYGFYCLKRWQWYEPVNKCHILFFWLLQNKYETSCCEKYFLFLSLSSHWSTKRESYKKNSRFPSKIFSFYVLCQQCSVSVDFRGRYTLYEWYGLIEFALGG